MSYCGYVVEIKELRKHSNADKLQVATIFGNDTIVSLNVKWGDVGIYFPSDGQLSKEFCDYNNLVRKKDDDGNNIGGYMDPDKRNVKAIKLRGEKSDGLYLPIECLDYLGHQDIRVGDTITVIDGHEICTKYIPKSNIKRSSDKTNKIRKHKDPVAPLFREHADTEQLNYNLSSFKPGDEVEITLKIHGTSQRTAYVPTLKKYKRSLLDVVLRRDGTPIYDWGYVSGTRRVVLDDYEGGFYGSNSFREQHSKVFEGKLHKGETVYYEVAGYAGDSTPIMSTVDNSKVNDKEFIKQYGKTTTFSYGCAEGESRLFVYRMTMTNEDGDVIEYTPDYMRYRCEQMGVNTVPVFSKFIIPECLNLGDDQNCSAGEYVKEIAERFYDGADPIGKNHIREGVVCRIINRPSFTAYKTKNIYFKILEGIAKDVATAPDIEEAQEVI